MLRCAWSLTRLPWVRWWQVAAGRHQRPVAAHSLIGRGGIAALGTLGGHRRRRTRVSRCYTVTIRFLPAQISGPVKAAEEQKRDSLVK
jgi:hypothetical protein